MDTLLLSWTRAQFLLSLGFVTFFASLSVGLAWMLLFFKWRSQRTGGAAWMPAYRFWVRLFALALTLAASAAVVVLFQLSGLWSGVMERVGNVAGPLLGYAVLTVFVFKSCFLGVMLFGQRRVSERVHTFAVAMVAIGQTAALYWLIVLQAWLEFPRGARLFEGRYQVYDWAAVALDPSLAWRLAALCCAAALSAAMLILGVTAWQALQRKLEEGERLALRTALVIALGAAALQIPVAAKAIQFMTLHQPAKAAAIAGHWDSGQPADLVVLGWPQPRTQSIVGAWRIAGAGNWLVGRTAEGLPQGLDSYSGMQPPVTATFVLWRVLALTGVAMFAVALYVMLRIGNRDYDLGVLPRPTLRLLSATMCLGALASVLRIWADAIGMSPYVVQNAITQSEVLGPIRSESVITATLGFGVLYAGLMAAFFAMLFHAARYGVVPVRRAGSAR